MADPSWGGQLAGQERTARYYCVPVRVVLYRSPIGGGGRSRGLPDRVMGYVIECLVEAYVLLGAAGRLTTARPDEDVDHKDFFVDERGGYRNIYVQVKGSPKLSKSGTFEVSVDYPEGKVLSDARLVYVFCFLDVRAMRLSRVWVVPSADFTRLAPRTRPSKGRVRLWFEAGKAGKWNRYEIEPSELGALLLRYVRARKRATARKSDRPKLAA
jgi:hypothetical protein